MTSQELRIAHRQHQDPVAQPLLLGDSALMQGLREDILAAAASEAKVLILGETGVGKEIVARMVHDCGRRASRSFVTINCAGVPDSLLESELFGHVRGSFTDAYRDKRGLAALADQGTLFLDELGEMSLRMQALLLRFAETGEIQRVGSDRVEGRVNVRIVAATNRDLQQAIACGEFREDLYYRLNVLQLSIAPLRERSGDISLLLRHFLTDSARLHGVDPPRLQGTAIEKLTDYRWPGNVRQLKNVVERLVVRHPGAEIGPEQLPAEIAAGIPAGAALLPVTSAAPPSCVDVLWAKMLVEGLSFWTAVYPAFMDRELTKTDLRHLLKAGLQHTRGSYSKLVTLFRMAPQDLKRFLAFLSEHDCREPSHAYLDPRPPPMRTSARGPLSAPAGPADVRTGTGFA